MSARALALAQGLKRYTGAPCARGHSGVRYASTNQCVECQREHERRWRKENSERHLEMRRKQYAADPERHRERSRQWGRSHPEQVRERGLQWRRDNSERARERIRQWRQDNLAHVREYDRQHRLANWKRRSEQNREWHLANPERKRELYRQWCRENRGAIRANNAKRRAMERNQHCTCCTDADIQKIYDIAALCGPGAHVDHIVPLAIGGHHCVKNLQAITDIEHKEKTRLDAGRIAESRRRNQLLHNWSRFGALLAAADRVQGGTR